MLPFNMIEFGNLVPVKTTKIIQIGSGTTHVAVLYNNGELYGLGRNSNYALNNGSSTAIETEWHLIASNVRLFATSAYGTVIIQNDGTVQLIGRNDHVVYNDTTVNRTFVDCTSAFSSVINVADIVDIKLTTVAIMILTASGSVYGIGAPQSQQLGGNNTGLPTLSLRSSTNVVRKIFASATATAYLTTSDALLGAGGSSNGELGSGAIRQSYAVLMSSSSTFGVSDFWLGATFSYALRYTQSDATKALTVWYSGTASNSSVPSSVTAYTQNSAATGLFTSFVKQSDLISDTTFGLGSSTGLYAAGSGNRTGSGTSNSAVFSQKVVGFTDNVPIANVKGITGNTTTANFMWYLDDFYYVGAVNTNYNMTTVTTFTKFTNMPY